MFTDPFAVFVLWMLCLGVFSLAISIAVAGLWPGGLRFWPTPTTTHRVLALVFVGIGAYIGWMGANPVFLVLVGLGTLVLGLQHLGPKRWIEGRVRGVWLQPLPVRSFEWEGATLVLVLALGFRLAIPDSPRNRRFLDQAFPRDQNS